MYSLSALERIWEQMEDKNPTGPICRGRRELDPPPSTSVLDSLPVNEEVEWAVDPETGYMSLKPKE